MKYSRKTPKPVHVHVLTLTDRELADVQFALYLMQRPDDDGNFILDDADDRADFQAMYESLKGQQEKANEA